ncbi:ABC transporter ATP-binding protein [Cognatishimia maritima]|uniref:Carbohydrate ABC transporter ATP-binding protein, CUT1 family (TC 3.A.1.1.-) n=1 Tax=Cognatishimia maritima TaxID=870908 RepID=A0A1M5US20_9RHOB|nr:sn-glycerol-3-phosphate ABC transporter ATP-binding protein UgpC [Cognatishimia maritima]SHH65724.1 carbohydrate ABC transporter ATP-binding protein, CUT1 family (TC 3.A.1.1.-) [Cognatishimia maritima]
MASVTTRALTKTYEGSEKPALDALDLEIKDGEFLVLVGPSGCGKSTALKMIGGLEDVTSGDILIGEQRVNDYASRDRDIAMVFQSYALYPHMTVFDNIAFPLQIAKVPKDEIARKVEEVANILQLQALLHRKPGRLSGGQRQRVAMGRAIIRRPSVFLMDEPLSNLDAKLRVKMRSEVAQIQRTLGVTTIYVTHDQVEAMTMGDRVALMRAGVLQQVDTPDNMYHAPANTFVASFIGSPAMNLFHAACENTADGAVLTLGGQKIAVPSAALDRYPGLKDRASGPVIVGVRPEDLEDARLKPDHPTDQVIEAEIQLLESLGSDHMAHVALNATPVHDDEELGQEDLDLTTGSHEGICICRFSSQSRATRGETVRIAVAADRLHFFDPDTRQALRPLGD